MANSSQNWLSDLTLYFSSEIRTSPIVLEHRTTRSGKTEDQLQREYTVNGLRVQRNQKNLTTTLLGFMGLWPHNYVRETAYVLIGSIYRGYRDDVAQSDGLRR